MAAKSEKGNTPVKKNTVQKDVGTDKPLAKSKKQLKDIDLESDEKMSKSGKKSILSKEEDDSEIEDINIEDEVDSSKQSDADEDWDPDFDEFDLPKSSKKVISGKKSVKDTDDEFKVDEEFEDFFNSPSKKKYSDDDDY